MFNIIIKYRNKETGEEYDMENFTKEERKEMMEHQISEALAGSGLPYIVEKAAC